MRSFLAVVALAALSAIALAQSATRQNSDVHANWQAIDQLCGHVELSSPKQKHIVVDGKPEVRLYTAFLEGATLTLYPGTATEPECCAVKAITTTHSQKFGSFEFDGAQPGRTGFVFRRMSLSEWFRSASRKRLTRRNAR